MLIFWFSKMCLWNRHALQTEIRHKVSSQKLWHFQVTLEVVTSNGHLSNSLWKSNTLSKEKHYQHLRSEVMALLPQGFQKLVEKFSAIGKEQCQNIALFSHRGDPLHVARYRATAYHQCPQYPQLGAKTQAPEATWLLPWTRPSDPLALCSPGVPPAGREDLLPSQEQAKQRPDDRSGEGKGITCQVEGGSGRKCGEPLMGAWRRQKRWNVSRRSCLGFMGLLLVSGVEGWNGLLIHHIHKAPGVTVTKNCCSFWMSTTHIVH